MNSLESRRHQLIMSVAKDLSSEGYNYDETIQKLYQFEMFSNWDEWELYHRPVDISELKELL